MKKISLIAFALFLIQCSAKEIVYIKNTDKFFFYDSEGYFYLFNIDKKLVKKFLPKKTKILPVGKGMLFIKKNKKVYMPGTGGKYVEAAVYLLIKREKEYKWLLVSSFVDVTLVGLKPVSRLGYKSKYCLINYNPAGKNFRAVVKRSFKLVLEIDFTFLPKESFSKKNKVLKYFSYPVIVFYKGKKITIQTLELEKGNFSFKEGIGAFVFHKNASKKLLLLNQAKIKNVFYFEKKNKETLRAFYVKEK